MQKFKKTSLGRIGGEVERTTKNHRNQDIDNLRTPLNYYYKKSNDGLYNQWQTFIKDQQATFKDTEKAVAFEGMIITSDKAFFEKLDYVEGEEMTPAMRSFFDRAYKFALQEIGYHHTDENILSAVVHLDETTPHLQLYYIPVVDMGRKKVYAKGENGKVLRNEKGSPIQTKDEYGKGIYEYAKLEHPKICSSDFWNERGGQLSFGNLQDDFYVQVAYHYGLERGEIGSNKKHTTKYQWEKQQQELKLQQLNDKLKPMQEYLDAFQDAINGKKPFFKGQLEKQIVGLTVQYKQLEKEKQLSDKDKGEIFSQLQELQKKLPELQKHKDFLLFISKYAPDKLREAKLTANQRANAPKTTKSNFNSWTK